MNFICQLWHQFLERQILTHIWPLIETLACFLFGRLVSVFTDRLTCTLFIDTRAVWRKMKPDGSIYVNTNMAYVSAPMTVKTLLGSSV